VLTEVLVGLGVGAVTETGLEIDLLTKVGVLTELGLQYLTNIFK
jgi:hypothetical protein